jgi:hypothetical protein
MSMSRFNGISLHVDMRLRIFRRCCIGLALRFPDSFDGAEAVPGDRIGITACLKENWPLQLRGRSLAKRLSMNNPEKEREIWMSRGMTFA